jgi:hypothetical protein
MGTFAVAWLATAGDLRPEVSGCGGRAGGIAPRTIGAADALVVAVASRLMLILVDVLLPGLTAALRRSG